MKFGRELINRNKKQVQRKRKRVDNSTHEENKRNVVKIDNKDETEVLVPPEMKHRQGRPKKADYTRGDEDIQMSKSGIVKNNHGDETEVLLPHKMKLRPRRPQKAENKYGDEKNLVINREIVKNGHEDVPKSQETEKSPGRPKMAGNNCGDVQNLVTKRERVHINDQHETEVPIIDGKLEAQQPSEEAETKIDGKLEAQQPSEDTNTCRDGVSPVVSNDETLKNRTNNDGTGGKTEEEEGKQENCNKKSSALRRILAGKMKTTYIQYA